MNIPIIKQDIPTSSLFAYLLHPPNQKKNQKKKPNQTYKQTSKKKIDNLAFHVKIYIHVFRYQKEMMNTISCENLKYQLSRSKNS